jgi:photosystem II stability/assembly factor-like uncharacterized protein
MSGHVWIVSENGAGWKTTNSGNDWATMTLGAPVALRAITFVNLTTGWVVGDNGTIRTTTDGGETWSAQTSGTSQQLNAVAFATPLVGYVAGNNGVLLKTTNGGASWAPIGGPWQNNLTSVAAKNLAVYVTGVDGFCQMSMNGGASWSRLNFTTDVKSDVNDVVIREDGIPFFIGGGGYIRQSAKNGYSFTWGIHSLHATLSDIFFYDNLRGWACSDKNNAVLRTTDGGATWSLPQGTTVSATWSQKSSASGAIGNGYTLNPWDKKKIYCAVGPRIYMSADIGETWVQTATISATSGVTHTYYISPHDTNIYVVAYTGGGDHIRRSTDRGVTWTATITRAFSAYGMPLAIDYEHPDTLYFAPEDGHIYRSTDFAATWQDLGPKGFTSPCDFAVVRDSSNILYLGDSGPSRISRSTDYGNTWTLVYSGSGAEVPTIATGNMRNSEAYATAWSSGGVQKTTNYGQTWIQTSATSSAWGVDVSSDDPNVVMFGVYGGGQSYLSVNGGASFVNAALTGSNYAILAYDRSTFLAEQSGGLYKLAFTYTVPTSNQQIITLISPNGGENWTYGTTRTITWTAGNFTVVNIEYKTSPTGAWQTIATNVPSAGGTYAWTIPNTPTTQARIRVSDATDGTPSDTSDGTFTISVSSFAVAPASLTFGPVPTGSTRVDTLRITNAGTAPLVISSAMTNLPEFTAGRTSFTIPAGSADTLSVKFRPALAQSYTDTLRLATNSPSGVVAIPLSGSGTLAASVTVLAPNGGEVWQIGSVQNIRWVANLLNQVTIEYRTLPSLTWLPIASNVQASTGSFAWTIPNNPANEALVRVLSSDGTIVDESDGPFRIQSPTSVSVSGAIPTVYALFQNYPNPFNPSTQIRYDLPKESSVRLTVFNALGQEIADLVHGVQQAGKYQVEFSTSNAAKNLSSGIYYYRLNAGEYVQTRKLILLK